MRRHTRFGSDSAAWNTVVKGTVQIEGAVPEPVLMREPAPVLEAVSPA